MKRSVSAAITATVTDLSEIVLNVAVAQGARPEDEHLTITLDGAALEPEEILGEEGTRLHLLRDVAPGELRVDYRATATAGGEAGLGGEAGGGERTAYDLVRFRRPSRYADLDRLEATAGALFGRVRDEELLQQVTAWVSDNLSYIVGSSRVTDGASDTYLSRAGVCRDYAHLVIALLRARGVPARLVSVYAPGLDPMDFHAVVEAHVAGAWHVVDATRLAPREAMVRIGTGADAADTSFFTVHTGGVNFGTLTVTAVLEGDLPRDEPGALVRIG